MSGSARRPELAGGLAAGAASSASISSAIAAQHLGDAADVVEAQQHVGDDEAAQRQARAGVGQRHGRLELGDPVVADVADDRLVEPLGLVDADEPRAAADERVAPEPPLVDRLEQEARAAGLAQPEVGPERGEQIGVEDGC